VSSQGKQEQHLDGARHRDNAAVEKVPNCFTANFLLKDETRYDCSSIALRPVAEVAGEFIAL
jgi:hypothetical protein